MQKPSEELIEKWRREGEVREARQRSEEEWRAEREHEIRRERGE